MIKMMRTIAALALTSVAGAAVAAGPFPNAAVLDTYLHANYDNQCLVTAGFLDGKLVYRNSGNCGPMQGYNFLLAPMAVLIPTAMTAWCLQISTPCVLTTLRKLLLTHV